MELKVICGCGQKYAFDVEPIGGRMPSAVNCPVCNADGTSMANQMLAEQSRFVPPPPPIAPAPAPTTIAPPPLGGLKINREPTPPPLAPQSSMPPTIGALKPLSTDKKAKAKDEGEFSLVRGIFGAIAGSLVGCGLLFAFWLWAHFRFPLMGVATGAAAGYGARWLARGTDTTLGIITATIAGLSVTGTFVLMYGGFAFFNIISIIICAGVAYRASSE